MSNPIPYRFYRTPEGRTYSLYSAGVPANAKLLTQGYTVEHPDGTSGISRKPFATREEAQAWCDAHPNFPGMSQG